MNRGKPERLSVKYRKGYKYQLAADVVFQTTIHLKKDIITPRICLYKSGRLVVKDAYAYDGPSGPVLDRKTNMRGACGHDALYQLMRMELLPHSYWKAADRNYGMWLREDGSWPTTVKISLMGLHLAGGKAALPKNRKKVYSVPK